jgi:hypothetical protein
MIFALAACLVQLPLFKPFETELRAAVSLGSQARVAKLFLNLDSTDYLFRMARERGGLRSFKVAIIPSPPGWEATGKFWAIIHARQDIEDYHDPVYPIVLSGDKWKLGPEIPEDATTGVQIQSATIDVHLLPANSTVQVHVSLGLNITASTRAPLFRLNDNFHVGGSSATSGPSLNFIEVGDTVASPKPGDVVHAGSLLVPWAKKINPQTYFEYTGTINSANEDKIDSHACYLTAWWVPSLGGLPFTTRTRVTGPSEWILESEGKPIKNEDFPNPALFTPKTGEQTRCFKCDIPISYPKVIGGSYILAAEKKVGDRTYRAYHFDTSDNDRAKKDVQTIADAIAWYDAHLGPFPFDEYNCFDADTYYGIESYNYTLLKTNITSWAVSHEAGHTYFGGLVPCAYVHDSWNESMTQYVDSVLHLNNSDQTLEGALRSIELHTPLTEMPVAHEYSSATYFRGAYVLRMLERQIGTDRMYNAIRAIIADRVGKDTTWYDLRPYFEKAYGPKLDWFWRQWISGATFPKLKIVDAQGIPTPSGTRVHITVRQSGTAEPFRLRFRVYAKGINKEVSDVFEMRSPEATFELNLGSLKAYRAGIDTFGYVLTPRIDEVPVKP